MRTTKRYVPEGHVLECVKGMTKETCPYNPKLGCDCGAHKPREQHD